MSGEVECRAQSTDLLYIRISGFQRRAGGRRISLMSLYSEVFHRMFASVHSWTYRVPSYRNVEGKICLEISIFNIGYLKQQHIDCRNTWQTGIFRYYLFFHFMVWFWDFSQKELHVKHQTWLYVYSPNSTKRSLSESDSSRPEIMSVIKICDS